MIAARQTGPNRITIVTDTTVDTVSIDSLRVQSSDDCTACRHAATAS